MKIKNILSLTMMVFSSTALVACSNEQNTSSSDYSVYYMDLINTVHAGTKYDHTKPDATFFPDTFASWIWVYEVDVSYEIMSIFDTIPLVGVTQAFPRGIYIIASYSISEEGGDIESVGLAFTIESDGTLYVQQPNTGLRFYSKKGAVDADAFLNTLETTESVYPGGTSQAYGSPWF